jgi:hypothetical protein
MESRTRAFSIYGGLPALPILYCKAEGCVGVGRMGTIIGVFWLGRWVPLSEFMMIAGGGDRYIDVPCGVSRERVILQVSFAPSRSLLPLHWVSFDTGHT